MRHAATLPRQPRRNQPPDNLKRGRCGAMAGGIDRPCAGPDERREWGVDPPREAVDRTTLAT